MLVQQILTSKGDDGVVTVPPGTSVQKVAEILSTRRIGAVIVSADGKTAKGIVSERDIVRELGKRGAACLADKVETLMTAKIIACTRAEGTDTVLGRMTDGRFRHMPVIENGEMIGLISIGDVVKARLMELAAEKDALEGMIKGF
jgi:CBS domain-containing protein